MSQLRPMRLILQQFVVLFSRILSPFNDGLRVHRILSQPPRLRRRRNARSFGHQILVNCLKLMIRDSHTCFRYSSWIIIEKVTERGHNGTYTSCLRRPKMPLMPISTGTFDSCSRQIRPNPSCTRECNVLIDIFVCR